MEPCVGFFWLLPGPSGAQVILADKIPLSKADDYGQCRTHSGGHAEFWDALVKRRAVILLNLPTGSEYDEFPRGRVVYDTLITRFIIYIDERIRPKVYLDKIIREFCLPRPQCVISSDPHYRSGALSM